MLDWNWRILKTGLGFLIILGLMGAFAWFTHTVPHAVAGTLLALAIQSGLYIYAAVNHVHPSFDLTRPLHLMVRWDRIGFRTVKVIVEMVGLVAMGLIAWKFLFALQIVTFLAFGLLFTGAPVPLLILTHWMKVIRPSFTGMNGAGAPHVMPAPPPPARPRPRPRPRPAETILLPPSPSPSPSPHAPPRLTYRPKGKLPLPPGRDEVL